MDLETLELRTADDLPLRVDLRHDPAAAPRGLVVVCHGFKGFRRWGFFPWAGEQLAAAGWASAVLDFSCNGIGDEPTEFDRLDLFERNTYSREMADLDRAIVGLRERLSFDGAIGLLGHSRAAVNVVVRAIEDPAVAAVATWNGVGRALRFTERQLAEWEREGRLEFTNARTGQLMAMDFDFVRDVLDHAERFDLARMAPRMEAAHLIVHAGADMAVPVTESVELAAGREESTKLKVVEIEGSTHTFGAVHPFEGSTPALDRAMALTLDWFAEHLP
jgi:alpha-beta hydrolase superfamily lysophospholipase